MLSELDATPDKLRAAVLAAMAGLSATKATLPVAARPSTSSSSGVRLLVLREVAERT